ncbi:ABC transporter permease [Cryptosporangium aurantiacum]|uniref:FtsX-like permease family protein n=1 Tax=Cryptosporangium aurantiacum TaxID=134849 RepID=A0A1M7QNG5_9ACTN|nr:FtsX-like permease family protein [Cryptosporangium aurantiacum]SHN33047.1 FtsX-like permease family protein [Cryptosporangium aurantiacum]
MIRFGVRLTLAGGREAVARLILITTAVALGTGLLLSILAAANAVDRQFQRSTWLTSSDDRPPDAPLAWLGREDFYEGRTIFRIDVAAVGPDAPVPPGVDRLPRPGEYFVSPALRTLLADTPREQLGDRFPGGESGTIGAEALPDPDSLVILVGRPAAELADAPGAVRVASINTEQPAIQTATLRLILGVVGAGLLFPVLIFVGTASRLSAARREQRFAALRLVGATPRQISTIATVESAVAAALGTAIGFVAFFAVRRPLADVPFTGAPFHPEDVVVQWPGALLVAVGIPLAAALAARITLRRVRTSPLGVVRRATPRPPRAYRLIPLVAGLAELAWFVGRRPETSAGQTTAYLTGMLLIMVGLVIAGPWLTMLGSRALAARSRRPATLIAARRLADDPRTAFRAVSGLVLALFVASTAIGVITTIVAYRGSDPSDTANSVLVLSLDERTPRTLLPPTTPDAALRSIPGVEDAATIRIDPPNEATGESQHGPYSGLVLCADLARTPVGGTCEPGAEVASVWAPVLAGQVERDTPQSTWPTARISAAELTNMPIGWVLVGTDGSTAALERSRTFLEQQFPGYRVPPGTDNDFNASFNNSLVIWQRLANVVILGSLPIAGCGLAVAVVGGLSERKRPFALLRLSGVPLRMLRRVVALESAVPLLTVSAVAIGTGLLAAHLFLRAQMDYSLRAPGVEYYVIVAVGLAASLAVLASTLPLLRRLTGPESARNE